MSELQGLLFWHLTRRLICSRKCDSCRYVLPDWRYEWWLDCFVKSRWWFFRYPTSLIDNSWSLKNSIPKNSNSQKKVGVYENWVFTCRFRCFGRFAKKLVVFWGLTFQAKPTRSVSSPCCTSSTNIFRAHWCAHPGRVVLFPHHRCPAAKSFMLHDRRTLNWTLYLPRALWVVRKACEIPNP